MEFSSESEEFDVEKSDIDDEESDSETEDEQGIGYATEEWQTLSSHQKPRGNGDDRWDYWGYTSHMIVVSG